MPILPDPGRVPPTVLRIFLADLPPGAAYEHWVDADPVHAGRLVLGRDLTRAEQIACVAEWLELVGWPAGGGHRRVGCGHGCGWWDELRNRTRHQCVSALDSVA